VGRGRALEIRQVFLGHGHGFCFVAHAHIDDPVLGLHVYGAHLVGIALTEPAAFDHGRSTHTNAAVVAGDDHVAAAE
jgi:hypothetical protein